MPRLHEPEMNGRNYCGPTALSAITGVLTAAIEEMVARHWRRPAGRRNAVGGMSPRECADVLERLGYRVLERDVPRARSYVTSQKVNGWRRRTAPRLRQDNRLTLAGWLRQREPRNATYLVDAGHHWIAVAGNAIADTRNGLTTVGRFKGRRARVRNVYEVQR